MQSWYRVSAGRAVSAAVLLVTICVFPAPPAQAQSVHEILQGTLGDVPKDVFRCGRKGKGQCGLTYRYYCVEAPDEVNGPAREVSGRPKYKGKRRVYEPEALHTGNFPKAAALGAGNTWHLVWDGVRNADSPSHVGYYGAHSQKVEYGEKGNPGSANCLPVIGLFACFGQLGAKQATPVQTSPLGAIQPIGGLSPVPVPVLSRNGKDKVSFAWEPASGQLLMDGADAPIVGYRLYVYGNPAVPPSEKELADGGIAIGEMIPAATTAYELARSEPAIADLVTLSANLRIVYGGDVEGLYYSANGDATGMAVPDTSATAEADDASAGHSAPRAVDIESVFLEIRQKKNSEGADVPLFHATVDLVGEPAGQFLDGTTVSLLIDFNEEGLANTVAEPGLQNTENITLVAKLSRKGNEAVRAEFTGLDGLAGDSAVDTKHGRVVFAVPLEKVMGAVENETARASDAGGGKRRLLVWAEATQGSDRDRAPNTNDGSGPSVVSEAVAFTF